MKNYNEKMTEWKTLKQITLDVGGNNFLEVNLKEHPEDKTLLIGLSKGWYSKKDNKKKYKANILFSEDKVKKIIEALKEITN